MSKIVVTGASGFIGSCLVSELNNSKHSNIIAVDEFSRADKSLNLKGKSIDLQIHRDEFFDWFVNNYKSVSCVYHLGARTDTTEFDVAVFDKLNLNYSKKMWQLCTEFQIPLIYASSAATYGSGEHGYSDSHDIIPSLKPLNPYGDSKNDFDKWVLLQTETPPFWAGMKFFNVFGPNEYHKARMASVVFHSFNQIAQTKKVKLFRSHKSDYGDGMQIRDFVYVKDVVKILTLLMETKPESGIYNLGTGKARTFLDLAKAVFNSLEIPVDIEFIDIPADIRDKYQYYTEADMSKLFKALNLTEPFTSLESSIDDYVKSFLKEKKYF